MTDYDPGDTWDEHYRGYELRINADGDIWWQVYNGTTRLHLEPKPDGIVEQFLELKPLGGRARVTDGGAVITRKEDEDADGSRGSGTLEDYTSIYVGHMDLAGALVPQEDPEYKIPVRPDGVSSGDLWPSVYDGARYSFSMDGRSWWYNSSTKQRYPIAGGLPQDVQSTLTRLKPEGGSFRVTPWGDIVTLVGAPATKTVQNQFGDLPPIVRNIIKLRRERADLQMLPLYVGHLDGIPLEVEEPTSLTDELSDEEEQALENWAASLGSTSPRTDEAHTARRPEETSDSEDADDASDSDEGSRDESADPGIPADDPVAWLQEDMDKTEERIDDRTS